MQSLEIIVMCFDSLERRNRWAFMKTFNSFRDVRRFLLWLQSSPIFLKSVNGSEDGEEYLCTILDAQEGWYDNPHPGQCQRHCVSTSVG